MEEEKGRYITAECFWLLMEGSLFLYFYFVCAKFDDTYHPKEDEPEAEEPKKDDEKKKE